MSVSPDDDVEALCDVFAEILNRRASPFLASDLSLFLCPAVSSDHAQLPTINVTVLPSSTKAHKDSVIFNTTQREVGVSDRCSAGLQAYRYVISSICALLF